MFESIKKFFCNHNDCHEQLVNSRPGYKQLYQVVCKKCGSQFIEFRDPTGDEETVRVTVYPDSVAYYP